jgi:hypothetical protein
MNAEYTFLLCERTLKKEPSVCMTVIDQQVLLEGAAKGINLHQCFGNAFPRVAITMGAGEDS